MYLLGTHSRGSLLVTAGAPQLLHPPVLNPFPRLSLSSAPSRAQRVEQLPCLHPRQSQGIGPTTASLWHPATSQAGHLHDIMCLEPGCGCPSCSHGVGMPTAHCLFQSCTITGEQQGCNLFLSSITSHQLLRSATSWKAEALGQDRFRVGLNWKGNFSWETQLGPELRFPLQHPDLACAGLAMALAP